MPVISILKESAFDVIGNLDADVSFEPDHFETLVERFVEYPQTWGLLERRSEKETSNTTTDSRAQTTYGVDANYFAGSASNTIGGYSPLKGGGVDLVAVVTARMNGWDTRTFPERVCIHHRIMNTAMNKGLKLKFKWGQSDYRLGSHPVWQLFRCCYQMTKKPYLAGGMIILSGYFSALVARTPTIGIN